MAVIKILVTIWSEIETDPHTGSFSSGYMVSGNCLIAPATYICERPGMDIDYWYFHSHWRDLEGVLSITAKHPFMAPSAPFSLFQHKIKSNKNKQHGTYGLYCYHAFFCVFPALTRAYDYHNAKMMHDLYFYKLKAIRSQDNYHL